jgi:hypothetical protein
MVRVNHRHNISLQVNNSSNWGNTRSLAFTYHNSLKNVIDTYINTLCLQKLVAYRYLFQISTYLWVMLGGSLVTTVWHVFRLRMEETPSSYGGQLRIYLISKRGQPTRGGPLVLGLGVGLISHHKKISLLRTFKRGLGPGRIPWINDLSDRTKEG